jgi:predicted GIY-YIG superfamily endonuclease
MKGRIYKISNAKNGRFYIGATRQSLEERFEFHKARESCPRTSKFYKHYDELC